MTVEEQIRQGLWEAEPVDLVPPPGLADTVLRRMRQARRNTFGAIVAAVAVVMVGVPVAVVGVPVVLGGGMGLPFGARPEPECPAETAPDFPKPGGGPMAVHVYRIGEHSYVLNPKTGRYQEFDPVIRLSPDLRYAAVAAGDGRIGIVERETLLTSGEQAIHWLADVGDQPEWAPDGSAFVYSAINKEAGTVSFTAIRYDFHNGDITRTRVPVDILGSRIGWAPDSRNYLVLPRKADDGDNAVPGNVQVIEPSGGVSGQWQGSGLPGGAQLYSPARDRLVTDAAGIMSADPTRSPVFDAATGRVVAELPPRAKPIGWYADKTIIVLAPAWCASLVLEFVDADTGVVDRSLELPGVLNVDDIQVGPLAEMSDPAGVYGF